MTVDTGNQCFYEQETTPSMGWAPFNVIKHFLKKELATVLNNFIREIIFITILRTADVLNFLKLFFILFFQKQLFKEAAVIF